MDQKNLDIYGHPPIPWSRAGHQLDAGTGDGHFLATVRPDGRPHVAGIGALWGDGKFYFVSSARTRKSRNLAERADCVISVTLPDLDLIVEGKATKVTDGPTLQRLAERYDAQGWPATVQGRRVHCALQRTERRATIVGRLRIHANDRVRCRDG